MIPLHLEPNGSWHREQDEWHCLASAGTGRIALNSLLMRRSGVRISSQAPHRLQNALVRALALRNALRPVSSSHIGAVRRDEVGRAFWGTW